MSTSVLPVHVALVSTSRRVSFPDLQRIAGALQTQVTRDVAPVWQVAVTVSAEETAPRDAWVVHVADEIDAPGAAGVHMDDGRQPYALVDASAGEPSLTISHEAIEMIVDPWGNRLYGAAGPVGSKHEREQVRYLVEACDPSEDAQFGYEIGGVPVSDFLLPAYYHSVNRKGTPCSFTGAIQSPRTVLTGGYVSYETADGHWWQVTVFDGAVDNPCLGMPEDEVRSLRAWVDELVRGR
jgi:hypothetical protein